MISVDDNGTQITELMNYLYFHCNYSKNNTELIVMTTYSTWV